MTRLKRKVIVIKSDYGQLVLQLVNQVKREVNEVKQELVKMYSLENNNKLRYTIGVLITLCTRLNLLCKFIENRLTVES
jgi:hypothetical protein